MNKRKNVRVKRDVNAKRDTGNPSNLIKHNRGWILSNLKYFTRHNIFKANLITNIDTDPREESIAILQEHGNTFKVAPDGFIYLSDKSNYLLGNIPIVVEFDRYDNSDKFKKADLVKWLNQHKIYYIARSHLVIIP